MPKRLLDHDDTASLGVSLNTDGKSLNNVGKLLTALRSGKDRNATRSAIIALERLCIITAFIGTFLQRTFLKMLVVRRQ